MALSSTERQKLINDVANASGIDKEIINSKMTNYQLMEAGKQLEILVLLRDARKDTELTEERYQCKSCNTVTRMIVLSQPTLLSEDKIYQDGYPEIPLHWWTTYAQILSCPSCSKVNVLTMMYSSDIISEHDESGRFFYVPTQTTFRLTDQPLKEEVQEQINNAKLQNPNIHKTIQLIDGFIEKPLYRSYLMKLLEELENAIESKAEFSSRILCGAIAEALLSYTLNKEGESLSKLIELAKNQNIFSENTKRFVGHIKDYRNTIHYDNWERYQLDWDNKILPIMINSLELLSQDLIKFLS